MVTVQALPHLLIGLGSVFGLLAAGLWWRRAFGRSATNADLATSLALGFASSGYLLGRVVGTF